MQPLVVFSAIAFVWLDFNAPANCYNISIATRLKPQSATHLNAVHELLLRHVPLELKELVFYHLAEHSDDNRQQLVTISEVIGRLSGQRTARIEHIMALEDKSHYLKRMTLNVILVENARSFR